MEIGLSIGLSPRENLRRFTDLCRKSEAAGVDAIWVIDSQLAMKDAYTAISIALWETETLRLGTGVTNAQTRHLSVTANTAATLADMSGGRFLLGLGAGDSAVFPLGWKPSKVADLEAAIPALRTLVRGGSAGHAGGPPVHLSFAPAVPPPVYLSASQPRMLSLAGREADGVIVMGAASRDLAAAQIEIVNKAAAAAGRAAGEIATDLWLTIAVDDDEGRGVDAVRSWASAKARWMSGWKDLPPVLERFRPQLDRAAAAYDFSAHLSVRAGHAGAVSDELASTLAIAGPARHCAERLRELSSLGPERLTLTLLSGGREKRLDVLMNEVLPALRD